MILGRISINKILWIYVPCMIVTPLYTYYMAVSTGEEPPYPHATVTSTATYYPQDIVFRYVMLFCSSILALTFYIVFRWVEAEAERIGYPKMPKYQFYLTQLSIVCYGVTIGTIDGQGIGNLHGPCAVIFFIVWLITIINMTVYMSKMRHWDTSVMSEGSLTLKKVLALYIAAVWGWCIFNILQEKDVDVNKQDIYSVIVEWNSVMINLLWVLSMAMEWKHFNLCFKKKEKYRNDM